jgi:hypothetical protein
LRNGENAGDPEASAEEMKAAFADEGDSEEVTWRRALLHRARESAGHALYEDWTHFTVDAQVVTAVKHAAETWTELAAYVEGLHHEQGKAAPLGAPALDNDLNIPPFLRRDRVQP